MSSNAGESMRRDLSLRICQVVENLEVGGLERIAVDLGAALAQSCASSSIYCLFEPGTLSGQAVDAGVGIKALRKAPGFTLGAVKQLARWLREDRIELVHTHNSVVHHYAVLAAKLAGVRHIVNTRHGLGIVHTSSRQELYYRAVLPLTDAVVCVSENARRFFTTHRGVPEKKCRVILNGIPTSHFVLHSASPGSRLPVVRFGTVGRLTEAKAHSVLLDAFARVRRENRHAELKVFGDGSLKAALRAKAVSLDLDPDHIFPGSTLDTAAALEAMDVFVLSSITEGLPVSVLEAMAAGLPVVATSVGGVPEVVKDGLTGWLCAAGDAGSLAAAMSMAANSTKLAEMGRRAQLEAESRFTVERMEREYRALYNQIIAGTLGSASPR